MWADLYKESPSIKSNQFEVNSSGSQKLTYRVESMPLAMFLRQLSADSGLSVVWSENLDDTTISLSVAAIPARDVLTVVARRLGVQMAYYGNLYYLGSLQKTDRASYVTKVNRIKQKDIEELLKGLKSDIGNVTVLTDGTVLMMDNTEYIIKADRVLSSLQNIEVTSWFVQLYLAGYSNTEGKDVGLETTDDINLAASLVDGNFGADLTIDIMSQFKAELSRSNVSIVASPLLVLVDGSSSTVKNVETVPVPEYTTSSEGTVTVSGYEEIESGFVLTVDVRDWGDGRANLSYDVNIGEITGYVDNYPIVTSNELAGEVVVNSGGVYLLGSLTRNNETDSQSGFLGLTNTNQSKRDSLLRLWAKVQRIDIKLGADVEALVKYDYEQFEEDSIDPLSCLYE